MAASVTLDWKAYFKAFEEEHGKNPVVFEGRLLFSDGWTYSASDHAGPEWPPPADEAELRRLQVAYWRKRKQIVSSELVRLRHDIDGLRHMQSVKSIPLRQVVRYFDSDAKKRVTERQQLDLAGLESRLRWLEADAADCEAKLTELGN